jgi:hypothetical protein
MIVEFISGYTISDTGEVVSLNHRNTDKPKAMKPSADGNGYLGICVRGKRYRIHRLVAENFLSLHPTLKEVNHIDRNKQNNHVSNLEWTNHSLNALHAIANGGINFRRGDNHHTAVKVERSDGKVFSSLKLAADSCKLKSATGIHAVCNGTRKTSGGYGWKYV